MTKPEALLTFLEKCKDNHMITPVPPKVIIEVLDYLMGEYCHLEDRYNGVLRALNARKHDSEPTQEADTTMAGS